MTEPIEAAKIDEKVEEEVKEMEVELGADVEKMTDEVGAVEDVPSPDNMDVEGEING